MEDLLTEQYYGNDLKHWFYALGIIVLAAVAGKILAWFSSKVIKQVTKKTKTRLDDLLIDMLEEPAVFAVIIFGVWLGFEQLHFESLTVHEWVKKVFHVLITLNVTWLIARTIDAFIEEYITPLVEKSESELDDQVLPIVRKGIRFIIWTLGIILALNNAGYDVAALLAGLGIGGLAFAMAAKDSVSNFFGGFTVLTDKPFKIGERVKIGGYDGNIIEIGIRSTRMKTLEGRIVTIPNAKFTDSFIENVTAEPSRKVVLNLGLTYDTSPEQMEVALESLKEIAVRHAENIEENTPISFNSFGDFSLGILFIYYIKPGVDILETQTKINLDILKTFNEKGLEMAFPTQTIYNIKQ